MSFIYFGLFIVFYKFGDILSDKKKIRILVAKPGLDGHDRGAKVIVQAFIEAGFEVIYTGLHQTIEQIVQATLQEDPNVIGLSILSGAHVPICEKLIFELKAKGLDDIPIFLGGVIPAEDHKKLSQLGVRAIYTAGSKFEEIVDKVREIS